MVIAKQLRDFAKEHDLIIHPARDPVEWAEKINANGEHCVCDFGRTCPCPESIDEVKSGERGACVCTFYVSDRYLQESRYVKKGGKWIKSKRQTDKSLY